MAAAGLSSAGEGTGCGVSLVGRGGMGPVAMSPLGSAPALGSPGARPVVEVPVSGARVTLLGPEVINLVMLWKVFLNMTLSTAHIFKIVCLT